MSLVKSLIFGGWCNLSTTEIGKPSRVSRYRYFCSIYIYILFKIDISETKYLDTQISKILEYLTSKIPKYLNTFSDTFVYCI